MLKIQYFENCINIIMLPKHFYVFSDTLKCRFPVNLNRLKGPHNSHDHSWIFDGHRFFARFQQIYPIWYAWIYVLGNEEDAQKYSSEITIVCANDNDVRFQIIMTLMKISLIN